MSYWIKERRNPQLGTYFVACGKLARKAAHAQEAALYGDNFMHEFKRKEDYEARLSKLRKDGKRVQ